jgi:lysophospholipase L1-like esterase
MSDEPHIPELKVLGGVKMRIFNFLKRKGLCFPLNLCIACIAGFLLYPVLHHQSEHPIIYTYGIKYLLYLILLSIPLICFLLFTLISDSRINRNIFLSILFIFIALEYSLRILRPENTFSVDAFYHPKPYMMFTGRPNSEVLGNPLMCDKGQKNEPYRFGDLGFRIETKITKEKPPGEYRIMMIGGSTVLGGVPLSNSIPSQIELQFHIAGFTRARVYNFGVVSYQSGQELSLLLHTLTDYRPDFVIVYDGGNDIWQPYKYDPRPDYPFNFVVFEEGFDRMRGKRQSPAQWISRQLHQSRMIRIFSNQRLTETVLPVKQLQKQYGYGSPEWEREIVDAYIGNLGKMCKLAVGFDFRILIILQPVVHFKTPLIGREKRLLGTETFQLYIRRQYERTRTRFADLANHYRQSENCRFLDLSRVMEGYPRETYWDFIHQDNAGHRFLAERIVGRILEERILPKAPARSDRTDKSRRTEEAETAAR